MYRHVYVAIDNSEPSTRGIDLAVRIAGACGARLTGSHVYAAALHERRFRQMESGLPEGYQDERQLDRQRKVHDSLIRRGLELIAHSYLDVFAARCTAAGVPFERRALEGKNYAVLLEDIARSSCDLVVLGARGLGATAESGLGSVCERLLRRAGVDLLIVRDGGVEPGPVSVAIDGSELALAGLRRALRLSAALGSAAEAVAVYDPEFHTVAFRSIAGVLSEEAGRLFHFREQERLHSEVIDRGLARVYQEHLRAAAALARGLGVELPVRLLAGKAAPAVARHVRERATWLLVAGRRGAHALGDDELGATAENLVRTAPCHVLVVAREGEETPLRRPEIRAAPSQLPFSPEAAERLDRVPEGFMREAVRRRVALLLGQRGEAVVTPALVEEAIAQGRQAMAGIAGPHFSGGSDESR